MISSPYADLVEAIIAWKEGGDDGIFMERVEDLLLADPGQVDLIVALFDEEPEASLRETWATIILSFRVHPPAIAWLRDTLGWTEKELRAYPGYVEWRESAGQGGRSRGSGRRGARQRRS